MLHAAVGFTNGAHKSSTPKPVRHRGATGARRREFLLSTDCLSVNEFVVMNKMPSAPQSIELFSLKFKEFCANKF